MTKIGASCLTLLGSVPMFQVHPAIPTIRLRTRNAHSLIAEWIVGTNGERNTVSDGVFGKKWMGQRKEGVGYGVVWLGGGTKGLL